MTFFSLKPHKGYNPFGSLMPGRHAPGDLNGYRYGFNGKEMDNEIKSITGSSYDYGMRFYDSRVGRPFTVDPIAGQFPELSPYQFFSNSPIVNVDLDGLEAIFWQFTRDDEGTKIGIVEERRIESVMGGRSDFIMGSDGSWHVIPENFNQSLTNVDDATINSFENADIARQTAIGVENITEIGNIATAVGLGAAGVRIRTKTPKTTLGKMKVGKEGGPGAGKTFSQKVKNQAKADANNKCVVCDTKTTSEPGPNQSNIDHAIPKSRGGNNTIDNAQNTCRTCNQQKKTRTSEEFQNDLNNGESLKSKTGG